MTNWDLSLALGGDVCGYKRSLDCPWGYRVDADTVFPVFPSKSSREVNQGGFPGPVDRVICGCALSTDR